MTDLYKVILNNTFQTVHWILKKNTWTNIQLKSRISCFCFVLFYFLFFSNVWGLHLAIYLRRKKHQSKHMDLRHVNIVSHKVTSGTLHYCTLFRTERWAVPKRRCQFCERCCVSFFFFFNFIFLKRTTEKTLSPTCPVILTLWSGHARSERELRAGERAARYKIPWKRDVGCGLCLG